MTRPAARLGTSALVAWAASFGASVAQAPRIAVTPTPDKRFCGQDKTLYRRDKLSFCATPGTVKDWPRSVDYIVVGEQIASCRQAIAAAAKRVEKMTARQIGDGFRDIFDLHVPERSPTSTI